MQLKKTLGVASGPKTISATGNWHPCGRIVREMEAEHTGALRRRGTEGGGGCGEGVGAGAMHRGGGGGVGEGGI